MLEFALKDPAISIGCTFSPGSWTFFLSFPSSPLRRDRDLNAALRRSIRHRHETYHCVQQAINPPRSGPTKGHRYRNLPGPENAIRNILRIRRNLCRVDFNDGKKVKYLIEKEPELLRWSGYGDILWECRNLRIARCSKNGIRDILQNQRNLNTMQKNQTLN